MRVVGYRELASHPEFRALWGGSALATAATAMSSLALGTLVHAETGSPLLTALVMFGPSLVQALGAGTLMSLADTVSPRLALVGVAAIMATAFALQALLDVPTITRLAIVLVAAYVLSIGGGVRWGLLSEVLPQDGYALGRSAMNVSVGLTQIAGFAGGGVLLTTLPISAVFWIAAGLVVLTIPITWFGIGPHVPRRHARPGLRETWRGNRILLESSSSRALLLALCIPNGLIAGCEALFIPYAGESASALFVAGALGMLAGDVLMGRMLRHTQRRTATRWLRLLLAVPFLAFAWQPGIGIGAVLVCVASVGYAASLGQQELLIKLMPRTMSGQLLGAESAARVTCQGLCAALAGATAELIPAGMSIAVLAAGSVLVSILLTPALRRAERAANSQQPSHEGVSP